MSPFYQSSALFKQSFTKQLTDNFEFMYGALLQPITKKFVTEKKADWLRILFIGQESSLLHNSVHTRNNLRKTTTEPTTYWQYLHDNGFDVWMVIQKDQLEEVKNKFNGIKVVSGTFNNVKEIEKWTKLTLGEFDVIIHSLDERNAFDYQSFTYLFEHSLSASGVYFIEKIPYSSYINSFLNQMILPNHPDYLTKSTHYIETSLLSQSRSTEIIPSTLNWMFCQQGGCAIIKSFVGSNHHTSKKYLNFPHYSNVIEANDVFNQTHLVKESLHVETYGNILFPYLQNVKLNPIKLKILHFGAQCHNLPSLNQTSSEDELEDISDIFLSILLKNILGRRLEIWVAMSSGGQYDASFEDCLSKFNTLANEHDIKIIPMVHGLNLQQSNDHLQNWMTTNHMKFDVIIDDGNQFCDHSHPQGSTSRRMKSETDDSIPPTGKLHSTHNNNHPTMDANELYSFISTLYQNSLNPSGLYIINLKYLSTNYCINQQSAINARIDFARSISNWWIQLMNPLQSNNHTNDFYQPVSEQKDINQLFNGIELGQEHVNSQEISSELIINLNWIACENEVCALGKPSINSPHNAYSINTLKTQSSIQSPSSDTSSSSPLPSNPATTTVNTNELPAVSFNLPHFIEGTLIRYHRDKQIYVVENQKKRPIPSKRVFDKYNYEYDKVKVISDKAEMDAIPDGEELW